MPGRDAFSGTRSPRKGGERWRRRRTRRQGDQGRDVASDTRAPTITPGPAHAPQGREKRGGEEGGEDKKTRRPGRDVASGLIVVDVPEDWNTIFDDTSQVKPKQKETNSK
eukprot:Skav203326  [mRNA]  locus=scaffold284:236928:237257:- [translate_table: standard]